MIFSYHISRGLIHHWLHTFCDGAALWNSLDGIPANSQSIVDFKTMMQAWNRITSSCTDVRYGMYGM